MLRVNIGKNYALLTRDFFPQPLPIPPPYHYPPHCSESEFSFFFFFLLSFLSWMENKVKLTLKYIFFVCHNIKNIERAKFTFLNWNFYFYVNFFTFNFSLLSTSSLLYMKLFLFTSFESIFFHTWNIFSIIQNYIFGTFFSPKHSRNKNSKFFSSMALNFFFYKTSESLIELNWNRRVGKEIFLLSENDDFTVVLFLDMRLLLAFEYVCACFSLLLC